MKILIGSAWPYANGSLHIGHLAALLPADVLARYHRAIGNDVYFVSGSDCHGTPVTIRAKLENNSPQDISDFYHNEFCQCFDKFGFSFDLYTKTSTDEHKNFVKDFHKKMYEGKYVYESSDPQAYCEKCKTVLIDRFVIGLCPYCNSKTRGDQCDSCGSVLEPKIIIDPKCSICGEAPLFKETNHLFVAVSKLEDKLKSFINSNPNWRKNAIAFSNRYINEGLRDRAITREIDWGVEVPKKGYEDKRIYIWAENVLGYLSASKIVTEERGESFKELWGENSKHYYVHGKDNIPFHTIILPSLLFSNGENWHLPDEIISSEYLTLEGRKISTSQNYAIWIKDIVDRFNVDSLRYFLITNGPEKRDTDFSWREFVNSNNSELLGAYGNFVNRTLVFIQKSFNGYVPIENANAEILDTLKNLFPYVGNLIDRGSLKEALDTIFLFIRKANKFFDEEQPWLTIKSDIKKCNSTLNTCARIIANLSILLEPFIPFSSKKINGFLGIKKTSWQYIEIDEGLKLGKLEILFDRIEKEVVKEEESKLEKLIQI